MTTDLKITTQDRDNLVAYLRTRPYEEVYLAIPRLLNLAIIPEEKFKEEVTEVVK